MIEVSNKIFEKFKSKYDFGALGLFESICVASTKVENLDLPLSSVIIAPSGDAKTSMMNDVCSIFPNDTIFLKGLVTEYGLARMYNEKELQKKCICVNDIVDTIKTQPRRRVAGVLTFFKNLIDGEAEILQSKWSVRIKAKVSIVINIPKPVWERRSSLFYITTFFDRTIPFNFSIDWEKWKDFYLQHKNEKIEFDKIELKPIEVKIPEGYEERIVKLAENLREMKETGLARQIKLVKAFLCGNAILNGRDYIVEEDFKVWEMLKDYFRWGFV
jgi:hypothetical protein